MESAAEQCDNQRMGTHPPESVLLAGPQSFRRPEREQMKAAKWPASGRAERVSRARIAFHVGAPGWQVVAADVKHIAEDRDLEYE